MSLPGLIGLILLFLCGSRIEAVEAWHRVEKTGELRWGVDPIGAPYAFSNPNNPKEVIGFEVDVVHALAKRLNLRVRLTPITWDQLVPALLRDDCDLAVNGLEITADRLKTINFSKPYYVFSEQITVRKGDKRFSTLESLRGYRVGTLSASLAYSLLSQDKAMKPVSYATEPETYRDLAIGRIDAVFLDVPIAAFYATPNPALENVGEPIGQGFYAAGIRKDSPLLEEKVNEALKQLFASGELRRIYEKWGLWTPQQSQLEDRLSAAPPVANAREGWLGGFLPLLLKGAAMTVLLAVCSMALAVVVGFGLCMGKLYGTRILKAAVSTYIEVIRGTPLLIQLYLLYYGLPNVGIKLNAFVAAVLGIGLNYAAYEAEIYRAGILAIPKGQDEAARSLGMSRSQTLQYVIVPQAIRTILPPSTNDFIALFKDTSIVSVITVFELTKAYTQAATATYQFLQVGLLTAALYFLMSYPLSLWSRRMEARHHAVVR